jgi:ribonuclease VapC
MRWTQQNADSCRADRSSSCVVLTGRYGPIGPSAADHLVRSLAIEVVDVDADQAREAVNGFVRFGRGRHAAALNFGDCFVYGLTADLRIPIVCLGNDFPQTDLETISPGVI